MNKAMVGLGRYQWNSGAWFGGSLGGIAWMAIASLFLLANSHPAVALTPAIGFFVGLAVSVTLWNWRTHLLPFRALMIQFGILALIVPIVLSVIIAKSDSSTLDGMNWPKSSSSLFAASMIVPALMLWFILLERTADKSQTRPR